MYTPSNDMMVAFMAVTAASLTLGFSLGMLICMLRERTQVINYALRNNLNTMPELLRDLYPETFWELGQVINKEKDNNGQS
jgi:hypothetical protein